MKHYNITITGKVHRVGFRFSAMEAAYRFSVNGTVMNSASNKVFIEAEGSQENLEQFIAWCWKGPLGAKVDKVEIEESSLKNFTRFEIISKV